MIKYLPLVIGFTLLTACSSKSQEAQIKDQIAEANYCDTAADCVDVGAKCPFDCYIFVNKNESTRIKTIVDGFQSQCTYSCIAIKGVDCVANKCQPVLDSAMGPQ